MNDKIAGMTKIKRNITKNKMGKHKVGPCQTGLTRVVEQGEGWKDGGSDQPRLGSVFELPALHLQLGHLVRVELQQLKEVEEKSGDEKLLSSQVRAGQIRARAKISLAVKTTEEEDGKGCSMKVLCA